MGAASSVHDDASATLPSAESRQAKCSANCEKSGIPALRPWFRCGDANAMAFSPSGTDGYRRSDDSVESCQTSESSALDLNYLKSQTAPEETSVGSLVGSLISFSQNIRSATEFYDSQLAFAKKAIRSLSGAKKLSHLPCTGTSVMHFSRENSTFNQYGKVILSCPLAKLLEAPTHPGLERDAVFKAVTEKVECFSGVAIAKLRVEPMDDDDPVTKLGIVQYIRGAFSIQLKQLPSVRLVKADDERLFMAGSSPADLIKAGLALLQLCADLTDRFPDLDTSCSVGVAAGRILLLPKDYYGDAVNVASKLGEDNASPGDLAVSCEALDLVRTRDDDGRDLLRNLVVTDKSVQISGVTISHVLITLPIGASVQCAYPAAAVPRDADVYQSLSSAPRPCVDALSCLEALPMDWGVPKAMRNVQDIELSLTQECTMMQTDMSGFTRLTKKYGIMHFLALIMQCRKIYDDTIEQFGGMVIKYDGDNVITFFPTPEMAALAASQILHKVNRYNRGLDKDFQIRLKFGMSSGKIMMVGDDIAGSAWDDCCVLGEDLAEVGEILITKPVRNALAKSEAEEIWNMVFETRCTITKDSSKVMKYYNMQPLQPSPRGCRASAA